MRFASYEVDRSEMFGLATDDGVVHATTRFDKKYPSLRAAIERDALGEIGRSLAGLAPDIRLQDVRFLPVIPAPEKIVCAGVNYKSHAEETGRAIPVKPSMFIRLRNTLVGHEAPMIRPKVSGHFDFEGELALIIGKPGRYIAPEHALAHVAGYTCFNDGSLRDYQKHSVTSGKNFPATGPLGPWMVTADEIPDPGALTLVTRLNGREMQRSGVNAMIHSVQALIAFVSNFTPLAAGDVIATGTPEGVGHRRNPQVWMKPGDVIEVEISKIGVLKNPIVDEAPDTAQQA